MLLGQVEAFLEVARRGNVGRAAAGLYLSQPALTARIKGLEDELGAILFDRTPHGMRLTPAGSAFLPYAERAVLALRDGIALISDVEHGVAGELAIGATPAISTYVLPEILARFAEQRPKVRLSVRTGLTEEIIDMVVRGEVQLGLTRESRDRRVLIRPLYEDDLVLVARPDHPISARGEIDVSELHDVRFVLFDRSSTYYEQTSTLLRDAGISRDMVMELDNIAAAKRMVEHGLGVALLPTTAVSDALVSGALRSIRLTGVQLVRRPVVLVLRRTRTARPPAAEALCELLGHVPDLIPGTRRPD